MILGLAFCFMNTSAQTVSTASGTGYAGNYSINNPAPLIISFVVENTTASALALTDISTQLAPYFSATAGAPSAIKLYYSATSLSDVFDVTTAAWTQIGTGTATVPAALTVTPVITGLNFIIPAATQYRFALEVTKGLAFSVTAPVPSPNSFTTGGVTLKVGTFQIAGSPVGYAGVSPTVPAGNSGVFFGGSVTLVSTLPCAGTPNPGNTLSTLATVCPGISFTLSPQNATSGSGVTYQWQSATALAGPYTNVAASGTGSSYTTTQTAATFYRVQVTCSGNTTASTPIQVLLTPNSGCYCAAGSTNTSTIFEKIANVTFGTLNNSSTSFVGYENFTALIPVASFVAGATVPITVTGNANTYNGDFVRVWIDFNQNGNFTDAGEQVYTSTASAGPYNGVVNIPVGATIGNTRMRIRMYDGTFGNGVTGPCGDNTYGQVEDYTINIVPCVQGVFTAQPVNRSIACNGSTTFSVTATGSVLTYQWQYKTSATSPWINVANDAIHSGATTPTLTLTLAPSSFSGRQYRVILAGPCTAQDFSTAASLTITPLVATLNVVLPVNVCNTAAATPISITNPSGATSTVSFPSAPALNIAIPDNGTVSGINNTINVTTVPPGVGVTGLAVKLNLAHNWVGDLIIVLKAPNGKVFNLAAALSATGGGTASTGFTNTVISSAGVTALSAGINPYTATFKADARLAPIPSLNGYTNILTGPTGYIPDAPLWSDLFSQPNGNWTLALYDYYQDDLTGNRLINWSLDVTYGTIATGVFSPNTGLYTDAAGTIPYTGTAINTVYVHPATSTNYSVTVTTPNCVSAPLSIPYNVSTTLSGVTTAATVATCVNGVASITVNAAAGNMQTIQWQVSTNGGVTWTNVTDGGIYGGATTSTLTITGAPATANANRYRAIVSNACNSITTSGTTFTVNPNPVIVVSANPYTALTPGMTTTLSAAVSPNPGATYQWYRNGVLVPGATANTLVVDVDGLGDYTVTVGDVNGCSATSSAISIKDSTSSIVFIYPSPNTGQFQVRYQSRAGNLTLPRIVNVYDSKGSRVYTKTYTITTPYERMDVDLRNHGKGIYMIELTDRNGQRIKTGRVMIF